MSTAALKRAEKCKSVALDLAKRSNPDHLRILRFLRKSLDLRPDDADLPPLISHHESALDVQLAPSIPSPDPTPSPTPSDPPSPSPSPCSGESSPYTLRRPHDGSLCLKYPHLESALAKKVFSSPVPQHIPDPDSPYAFCGPLYADASDGGPLESYGYVIGKFTEANDWKVVSAESSSSVSSGTGFKWVSQEHYDWVASCVGWEFREKILVGEFGLQVGWIGPNGEMLSSATTTTGSSLGKELRRVDGVPIVHSPGLFVDENSDSPVLVLIPGAGIVRCGIWGMRKTINETIREGTAVEYLERAKQLGWRVLLLNPNQNFAYVEIEEEEEEEEGEEEGQSKKKKFGIVPIMGHRDPYEHVRTVFDAWKRSPAGLPQHILIAAHSFGGCVLLEDLLLHRGSELLPHLAGLALTDSVHDKALVERLSVDAIRFLQFSSRNWVKSQLRPNDPVVKVPFSLAELQEKNPQELVDERSAGTEEHDLTSQRACPFVFDFLDICLHCGGRLKNDPVAILAFCAEVKEAGNDCIRAKDVQGARAQYLKGLLILTERLKIFRDGIILDPATNATPATPATDADTPTADAVSPLPNDLPQKIEELVNTFRSNMALVELRLKNYKDAVTYASLVLANDKRNLKCLTRRGVAYFNMQKYDKAKESLVDAYAVSPQDRQVRIYLAKVRKILRERTQAEKVAYGKMFK